MSNGYTDRAVAAATEPLRQRIAELEQRIEFLRTQVVDLCAAIDGKNLRIGQLADSCANYATRNADQEKRIAELTEALQTITQIGAVSTGAVKMRRIALNALHAASAGKEG